MSKLPKMPKMEIPKMLVCWILVSLNVLSNE